MADTVRGKWTLVLTCSEMIWTQAASMSEIYTTKTLQPFESQGKDLAPSAGLWKPTKRRKLARDSSKSTCLTDRHCSGYMARHEAIAVRIGTLLCFRRTSAAAKTILSQLHINCKLQNGLHSAGKGSTQLATWCISGLTSLELGCVTFLYFSATTRCARTCVYS